MYSREDVIGQLQPVQFLSDGVIHSAFAQRALHEGMVTKVKKTGRMEAVATRCDVPYE